MIDSHSHIYTPRFDADRGLVLARAVEAGITQLLQVGCNLAESRAVLALAEATPGIYAAVGVHPHDADTLDAATLAALHQLACHPKVVAWGEIGLDFYYDNSPREAQLSAFECQMKAVAERDLPVVIHTRDAEPETLEILRAHRLSKGGQVHCFTGSRQLAVELLELGYHIGFTGIITFKNAADLREVVAMMPMDRLLIETDSPYLAPIPHRGKRNEPAYVVHVAEAVAAIKGLSTEQVVRQTSENFHRLYGTGGRAWERLGS